MYNVDLKLKLVVVAKVSISFFKNGHLVEFFHKFYTFAVLRLLQLSNSLNFLIGSLYFTVCYSHVNFILWHNCWKLENIYWANSELMERRCLERKIIAKEPGLWFCIALINTTIPALKIDGLTQFGHIIPHILTLSLKYFRETCETYNCKFYQNVITSICDKSIWVL